MRYSSSHQGSCHLAINMVSMYCSFWISAVALSVLFTCLTLPVSFSDTNSPSQVQQLHRQNNSNPTRKSFVILNFITRLFTCTTPKQQCWPYFLHKRARQHRIQRNGDSCTNWKYCTRHHTISRPFVQILGHWYNGYCGNDDTFTYRRTQIKRPC